MTGPKQGATQCINCGNVLQAKNGSFEVVSSGFVRNQGGETARENSGFDSGVIDVDVVDD